MDVFDLVYQIRMELEEARLAGHQVTGLREQMMHRLRSRAADDEAARVAAAEAASSAAVEERLREQKRELNERLNQKLEQLRQEHQRALTEMREEQAEADKKKNKMTGKVEGYLINLQKHLGDELKKSLEALKESGGTNGIRQASFDDLDSGLASSQTSTSFSELDHSDDNGLTNLFQNLSQSTARLKQVNSQLCTRLVSSRRDNIRLGEDHQHSAIQASALKENLDSCMKENERLKAELNASRGEIKELKTKLETERQEAEENEIQLAEMLSAADGAGQNNVDAAKQAKVARLQLKLRRAEYRASVAEQCCEQTKLTLNEKLIQVTDLQSHRMF